jgi:MtrB/PioB family decaheme-associated outer membrane protein
VFAVAFAFVTAANAQSLPANVWNPDGLDVWRRPDPRGLSLLRDERLRSPTGILYPWPLAPPSYHERSGWLYRGSAGVGAIFDAGDEDEARYAAYFDADNSMFASQLRFEALQPERGLYLEGAGGGVGTDDQYYWLEGGRYGWFRLLGSFSRMPHHFANDATILYTGSDNLTLRGGLIPGGNLGDAIDAVLAATPEQSVKLQRDRSSLGLDLRLRPDLTLRASYGFEDRDGDRAFGVGFSWPPATSFSGEIEIPRPVDDRTHNVRTGLEYSGGTVQMNLFYSGSFYRNDKDSLTLENPLLIAPAPRPEIEFARFALEPDNDAHHIKGDVALALPFDSRLAGSVAWGRMKQNDRLLPPTINDVTLGFPIVLVDLNNWNTPDALSTSRANAQIDTLLVDVLLQSRPWRPLTLKARIRSFDQDNDTSYKAENPITGELGYIVEDGGHAAVFPPLVGVPNAAAPNWHFRSIPFGYRKTNYELGASYRAFRKTRFNLSLERESTHRDVREREDTDDDRLRLSVSTRAFELATLRASLQLASRDGDSFDANVYDPFFTAGTTPLSLPGLERPDVADRDQQIWSAQLNLLLGETMDLALVSRFRHDDYDTDFGLQRDQVGHWSAEWSYQPTPEQSWFVWSSYEDRRRDFTSVAGEVGAVPYPAQNRWSVDEDATTFALGAGAHLMRGPLRLEASYSFVDTRTQLDYDFASDTALAGVTAAQAGSRYPELKTRDHVLMSSLFWEFRPGFALRLAYRFSHSTLRDFQQAGLPTRDGNRIFFGHQDRSYQASLYTFSLEAQL